MSLIKTTTDADFERDVLQSPLPVLLDFYAPWCAPCTALVPTLDDLAREYEGEAVVVKINVDDNLETRNRFGIRSIPTLILFRGGAVVQTFPGPLTRSVLAGAIETAIGAA